MAIYNRNANLIKRMIPEMLQEMVGKKKLHFVVSLTNQKSLEIVKKILFS